MGRVVCNISGDSIALVRSVKPGISKDYTSMESSSFGELKISLKLSSFGHGSGDVSCLDIVFARQKIRCVVDVVCTGEAVVDQVGRGTNKRGEGESDGTCGPPVDTEVHGY